MKTKSEVYICEISKKKISDDQYNFFYLHLPDFRRKQVDTYFNYIDRIQYALSYSLFQYVCLKNNLNITEEELECTSLGKPFFNTIDKHFNISNCRSAVCCGFSDYPVGVDISDCIEKIDDIMEMVLCKNEIKQIYKCCKPEELFTWYWTLKESYLKYLGIGINYRLDKLDFSQFDIFTDFEVYQCNFRSKRIGNLYVASCAEEELIYRIVDIEAIKERIKLENEK